MIRLLLLIPCLCLLSCGGTEKPPPPEKARKPDVSFDSANRALFFAGEAATTGGFDSELPFSLWFTLAADPLSSQNEASQFLIDNHGSQITQRATFKPGGKGVGQIPLLQGRLILRGDASSNGKELEGTWYFDGLPGGTFWIAPQGTIFP